MAGDWWRISATCLWALVACLAWRGAPAAELRLFVSAFADGDDAAIQAGRFDPESGQLTWQTRTTGVAHPFYLAISPNQKFLYSIHAPQFGGQEDELVAAYALTGETGQLRLLNRQSARGTAACYLQVDATGRSLLLANYLTGSVVSFPLREDGALGEAASFMQHAGSSILPARQKGPHAHCFVVSPDNRLALAADLGLDQILLYQLDAATAQLRPHTPPFVRTLPGAGPRHLTFHPLKPRVYVINELANSVTHFDYVAATGLLVERQTISTLPADYTGTSHCADVRITPDGRFLYGTNRGHDSLACYRITDEGRLELIEIVPSRGKGPQNLAITPDGRWLLCANMPGNNVATFRIDSGSGKLQPQGEPLSIPSPSCIVLLK
ncbi:MAG: lactonase family protein [Pirellulales bacterium]